MKITEFLKKISLIDSQFIDDFYSFYDEEKTEYDQAINLNNVAKWLNVQKYNLKKLLKIHFILGTYYIEKK